MREVDHNEILSKYSMTMFKLRNSNAKNISNKSRSNVRQAIIIICKQ